MGSGDSNGLWSSRHAGASSLRGTLYLLGLGALLATAFLLTGWLWGAILGFLAGFLAFWWFVFSWEEIVDYAKTRPVLRIVLGLIFLGIGVGTLVAVVAVWDSVLDPTRPAPPGGRNPAVGIGFGIVVGVSCAVAGCLLLWHALPRRHG